MTLFQDLQFAARALLRDARISTIAVLGLALGIGLTAAMFSIVYGAVLRGLPFDDSNELLHLERANVSSGAQNIEVTVHDFEAWKESQSSFEDLAAYYLDSVNLTGPESLPARFDGAYITVNTLDLLRVEPLKGRAFSAADEDPSAAPVLLLGHDTWIQRFDADPGVVGRTLRANGEQITVIGVMPPDFRFPLFQDLWMPLRLDALRIPRGEGQTLKVIGRLAPGASVDTARADLTTISRSLETQHPDTNAGMRPVVAPYITEMLSVQVVSLLYTMLVAVFGVLLIACANVSNLLLARASMRGHDIAVRAALGATRRRLAGLFLAEAVVLSLAGGVLGILFARLGIALFNGAIDHLNLPFWIDIRLDPAAILCVMALVVVSSLIAGIVPGLKASGGALNTFLREGGRGGSSLTMGRLSRGLVIAEIALSCCLLIASGLMIRSVVNLRSFDFNFLVDPILTARISLPEAEYGDAARRDSFFQELRERLESESGIGSAGLSSSLPVVGTLKRRFAFFGESYGSLIEQPYAAYTVVSPGALEAFSVDAVSGRLFGAQDRRDGLPVALVNESFRQRFFSDRDPLGERLKLGAADKTEESWRTIVGVIPDTLVDTLSSSEQEGFFVPLSQSDVSSVATVLRTQGSPAQQTQALRRVVADLDPNLPIYNVAPMEQVIADNTWFYGTFGGLFMVFGVVSLLLAVIGLYGVMAFSVSRRRRELALRMALGAEPRQIIRMIVRQGLRQTLIGLAIGLVLAVALAQLLGFLLLDVSPLDPLVFALVIFALVVTGFGASLLSSLEVTSIEPVTALKDD